jgi:hypothetical protein
MENDNLRDTVRVRCTSEKKKSPLAIIEAFAGSDVADLRTTAEKTARVGDLDRRLKSHLGFVPADSMAFLRPQSVCALIAQKYQRQY